MIQRLQSDHADLGLIDDDKTEDMRKAPVATTEARREPTQVLYVRRWAAMRQNFADTCEILDQARR